MSSLPLFDAPKTISPFYRPDADIVLYEGDTTDFIDSMPDEAVKLIVTSPPYNLGKEYEDRVSIERYLERQAETIAKPIASCTRKAAFAGKWVTLLIGVKSTLWMSIITPSSSG